MRPGGGEDPPSACVYPTLRQTWPRAGPEAAMCVRKISAQCVLQFTPSLAAGCVLHRPVSRVIHCSELYSVFFFQMFLDGVSPVGTMRSSLLSPVGGSGSEMRVSTSLRVRPPIVADGASESSAGGLGNHRGGGTGTLAPLFKPGATDPLRGGGTPFHRGHAEGLRHPIDSRTCVRGPGRLMRRLRERRLRAAEGPRAGVRFFFGTRRLPGGRPTVMILPLVHQRKPCYDFYFL